MSRLTRTIRRISSHVGLYSLVAVGMTASTMAFSQSSACPALTQHEPTPAEAALNSGNYSAAVDLYTQALARQPNDPQLAAALARTQLRMGKISDAADTANKALPANPNSAALLTSLAEIQLRQGQPWLALESLKTAESADPCSARVHLIRSKIYRVDSMYASERAEIQLASDLDPTSKEIHRAFSTTITPAHEIEGLSNALATAKDLDSESRARAEQSMRNMMPLLWENNQTCQVLPNTGSATFPLQASYQDPKHIDGYRLEVDLPSSKAHLLVDTAASGLFISRAVADQNGFKPSEGAPQGTVHVDSFHVGPLEFRDCVVGVNDAPFPGNADGVIGTDIFSGYLITLNFPAGKLTLAPLPPQSGVLPEDRSKSPELQGFTPVYHRQQFLLVPAMLNNKVRRLFMLDSGIRYSTMNSEVAHSVSTTKVNFTNTMDTASGAKLQVYRDSFDFQLANLTLTHQSHILEMNTAYEDQQAGMQIAGKLGFDMLHSLILNLDYRDGLVKLESPEAQGTSGANGISMTASKAKPAESDECPPEDTRDRPLSSTIVAKVTSLVDSAHIKPGKEITVQVGNEWIYPGCNLPVNAVLYGHITAASSSKGTDPSELSFVFDHGDCDGRTKKPLALRVIGVIGPLDQFVSMHGALPTEISGGGRNIQAAAGGLAYDQNLNPGGAPHTVHPGIVIGLPKAKLEPQGGPACSTRITSSEHSVRLGVGAGLVLYMYDIK